MWCLSKPVIKKKSNSESEPTTKIQQKKICMRTNVWCAKKIFVCCVYIKDTAYFFMSLSELYYNFKKHSNQMATLQNCQFNTKTKSRKL